MPNLAFYYVCRFDGNTCTAISMYGTDREKAEKELERFMNTASEFGIAYRYDLRISDYNYGEEGRDYEHLKKTLNIQ